MERTWQADRLEELLAHRAWIRRVARALVLDDSRADDLEQEAFLRALRGPSLRSPRAWLGTVLRNAAANLARGERRRARHEASAPPAPPPPSPADLLERAEVVEQVARAVREMEEPHQTVVLLRYFEDLSPPQVAARLGVPVETVRTRLKRALSLLRERLDAEEGGGRRRWMALLLPLVRRAVPGPPEAVAGGSALAIAAGVLAMGIKTKAAVAVGVLLAAGFGIWSASREEAPPAPRARPDARGDSQGPPRAAVAPPPRPVAPGADATALPPEAAPPARATDGFVVHGKVLDDETRLPVEGVSVLLVHEYLRKPGKEATGMTATDGTFRIAGVKDGTFGSIVLHAEGYAESLQVAPWQIPGGGLEKGDAGELRLYRGRTITGRVLGPDGATPVPGARIFLSRLGGSSGAMWVGNAFERGKTIADGTFALERVPPSLGFPYTLFAVAPGGIGWTRLPAGAGREEIPPVEVRVAPQGAATVTVRDEAGKPREGVRLFASPRFEPLGPRAEWGSDHDVWVQEGTGFDAILGASTDAWGIAEFPSLPVTEGGARYDFVAYGSGGNKAWKDGVAVPQGGRAQIDLVVGEATLWAIEGLIRAQDGSPVADALVRPAWGPAAVRSDREGKYRVTGLEAGWEFMRLEVDAAGFAPATAEVRRKGREETASQDIQVERATPLAGKVVDQAGVPLAGIVVTPMRSDTTTRLPGVTTGDDGGFSFPKATAGEWSLSLMPPPPYDEWAAEETMPLVRGGDRDIVVVLARVPAGKTRLLAEVIDSENGAPLTAEEVMLIGAEQASLQTRLPSATPAISSGRVTAERVQPGRWRLWVRVPGRPPAVAGFVAPEGGGDVRVRVLVGRPANIRGRMDLPEGMSPPHMVFLSLADERSRPSWAVYRTPGTIDAAFVARDGTFLFEGVMPARYRITADAGPFLGEGVVEAPSGGEATVTVTFRRGTALEFRLAAPSPSDVVVYEVSHEDGPWKTIMRLGGEKGRASPYKATLPPGRWRWRVSFPADGFAGSVRAAAEPVEGEATLAEGASVTVTVPVVPR